MVKPLIDALGGCWDYCKKKVAVNLKHKEPEKQQMNPINGDLFLTYNRPLMKFYSSFSTEFSFQVPRYQEAMKSAFPRAMPISTKTAKTTYMYSYGDYEQGPHPSLFICQLFPCKLLTAISIQDSLHESNSNIKKTRKI